MKYIIGTQTNINAPLNCVWNAITDFPSYGSWNPVTPKIRLVQPIGATHFIFRSVRIGKLTLAMRSWLKSFEPPYEISWGTNWIFIRYERSQSLRWIDNESTQHTTCVRMSGILAPILFRILRKKLRRDHQLQSESLKAYTELQARKPSKPSIKITRIHS